MPSLVGIDDGCDFAASRDKVMGLPYRGWLVVDSHTVDKEQKRASSGETDSSSLADHGHYCAPVIPMFQMDLHPMKESDFS